MIPAPERPVDERRVLFLSPSPSDGRAVAEVLREASFAVATCGSIGELANELAFGAGAVVLAEESLGGGALEALASELALQPPWSDLPLILLARPGRTETAFRKLEGLERAIGTTILERPVQRLTLLSAVRVALRARDRQYEVRSYLEERVALLAAERSARTEAERASRTKDEFLATLSHELRTPMSAVLGWTQVVRASCAEGSPMLEGLEVIERNARVQAQLIDDLLDVNRIIAGKLSLEPAPLDLREVVRAAVATVALSAEQKRLTLDARLPEAPVVVRGDRGRLQQVVWNLLSNAVKFTPAGGRVEVELDTGEGAACIRVVDSGIGIPPEHLGAVFDRFRQADSSIVRRHGGLGLGLSIVKSLVVLHGGKVEAASEGEGRGTRLTVTLPLCAEGELAAPAAPGFGSPRPAAERARLDGVHVLVLDDEPDARALVRRVLEARGALVTTAASASEGIACLEERRPDVILSDIGMPVQDGYEFLRNVRALPRERGGRTPAIALTAFVGRREERRARRASYQAYLAKPFEPENLVRTVRGVLDEGVPESEPRPA